VGKSWNTLVEKPERKRHLVDLDVDRRIIIKLILEKNMNDNVD
jgi:hypothetical protein